MSLNLALLGIWETPATSYWLFYLALGSIGFLLSYFHRFLSIFAIGTLLYFAFSHLLSFSRPVRPGPAYQAGVVFMMLVAFLLIIGGAYLNWRKNQLKLAELP